MSIHTPAGDPVNGIPALTPYQIEKWPQWAKDEYEAARQQEPEIGQTVARGLAAMATELAARLRRSEAA